MLFGDECEVVLELIGSIFEDVIKIIDKKNITWKNGKLKGMFHFSHTDFCWEGEEQEALAEPKQS